MSQPVWLSPDVILAIHEEQLAEHGGGEGVRDAGLMESALARPRNLAAYGAPDLPALAAALGYGLARNHPFVDGNKRTAFVAVETFLLLNGLDLVAGDAECVVVMLDLAAGELPEAEFAAWLRDNTRPRG
ncbi:type II toxin-antitoxin system death-on-curing family toxin [Roseicella sp. DB1501]|uniref:type II toxin-antitoxin system death-on-curing family toxin n=1 Tax=Roseicella sp. DB1501 TaxID=2730925 RepID=UPI0014909558|nr:type II toxin-antitoxin system death-on-curing family toxin [Roseicella sp. DB1501]